MNSVEDLRPEDLGFASEVYEQSLGDDKYTFIDGVENPRSCTILIKGPNDHVLAQASLPSLFRTHLFPLSLLSLPVYVGVSLPSVEMGPVPFYFFLFPSSFYHLSRPSLSR